MKYLFAVILLLTLNAYAGGKHEKVPTTNSQSASYSNSKASAKANSYSGSVSSAKVGDVVLDSNNDLSNHNVVSPDILVDNQVSLTDEQDLINNSFRYEEKREFIQCSPVVGNHTIGETSVAVGGLNLCAGGVRERDDSSGLGAGISWTYIPGQGDALKKAQDMQDFKLHTMKVDLLHSQEKHQADLMVMCLELHKMGVIHEGGSPELKARCDMYEHHHREGNGPVGPHNGYKNPRQVSPHANSAH